jgi:CheY-like chemotaxis protein
MDLQETNGEMDSGELNNDRKMYVLIVEDEKINANIFKMYIQGVANVSLAYSGNEAMNIIELHYNKGIIFSLVFMDIGLPEPWNGIMLKEAIEKKWPEYGNVPFVAQTAYSGKNIADQIINANFKGYLVKPINRNDVLRFIQKYTRK